jgi:hypothetical protein
MSARLFRRIPAFLVINLSLQPWAAFVRAQSAGDSSKLESKPELAEVVALYEEQEKAIDSEIEPLLTAARDKYSSGLQALIDKLNQAKRVEDADKVKAELKRFNSRGLSGEPAKSAPAEVRSAWSAMIRALATARDSVVLKRNGARAKFSQSLTGVEQAYRAKNDTAGVKMTRAARAAVSIRAAVEADKLATTDIAAKSDGAWRDVCQEGGYLAGFKVGRGTWFQFSVLGSLQPIFATMHGTRPGERRGGSGGQEVVARDGYAVGGLYVRSGEVVNAIQIIFMRINPDGLTLNPQDFYVTDWLGGEGGGKGREISARGRLVVGVTGKTGDVVEGIGLVYLK